MVNKFIARQTNPFASEPTSRLSNNDSNGNNNGNSGGMNEQALTIVVIGIALGALAGCIALYVTLRRMRLKNRSPKYLPSKFLKQKWENWQPKSKYKTVNSAERGETRMATDTSYQGREERAAGQAAAAGVDRNTSVRSVITLPAYSQTPKETEEVIGREGERGGMDTVVEFPETQAEEDAARENEMESLYQIRLARRREIAEREERRRERREARERGDWARLEELRRESRQRATPAANESTGNLTADTLIAEHNSRPKERRVSSVAYGALGQVRHDGTRVRANSTESERGGLLAGAAPMGDNGHERTGSDATSLFTINNLSRPSIQTGRGRSDSGALSISTLGSSIDLTQATPTTTNEEVRRSSPDNSAPQTTNTSPSQAQHTPPSSDRTSDDGIDPRIVSMIRESDDTITARPPEYDHLDWGDAPDYEEAIRRRESQRQAQNQRSSAASAAPALDVPRISVQLASEPSSPALTRVSEEQTRR